MSMDTTRHLLWCHVQFAYFIIEEYARGQRILNMDRPDLAQYIAEHGDALMFRSQHTKDVLAALVEAIALLAFAPGGVTFLGSHFEASPQQVADAWAWADNQATSELKVPVAAQLLQTEKETSRVTQSPAKPTSPSFENLFRKKFADFLQ